jgi:Surface-adhesin protein E
MHIAFHTRKKKALLTAVLMAAFCTLAPARTPHWQRILVPPDGRTIFVDTENISRQRKLVVTWILTNYKSAQSATHGRVFRSSVEKTLNDCESKRIATVWTLRYPLMDGNGKDAGDYEGDPGTENWISVLPRSVGDRKLDFACENAP